MAVFACSLTFFGLFIDLQANMPISTLRMAICESQLQMLQINFTLFSCGVNKMVNVDAMPGATFLLASNGLTTLK